MLLKKMFLGWMVLCGIAAPVAAADEPRSSRPNFVFLIGEGQGWSSLSAPMDDMVPGSRSTINRTPNLDKIAANGMRFTHFYAPSPRCMSSRAAFFTGKSPAQLHMTFIGEGKGDEGGGVGTRVIPVRASTEMAVSDVTIADLLKRNGYATAHFGKWHVGRTDPSRHGYDESDGATSNGGPENSRNPNPKQAYASARRGITFMEKAIKAGKPFYLQVAQYAGKSEEDSTPETYARVKARMGGRDDNRVGGAAVAEDADVTYGQILDALKRLGVDKNTYVFYTTDHGTPGRNTPLNQGKGTIWDGGLRVPFLISGPGIAPGTFARMRASGVDLYPTVAELANVNCNDIHILEGGSLVDVLTHGGKGEVRRAREEFVVHFPHYDKDPVGPASAIYLGNYKLVRIYETDERRLYDLKADMGERTDLARSMPEKVRELEEKLKEYLKSVDAQMPSINPDPDPKKGAASMPGDRRGGRGGAQGKGGAQRKGKKAMDE